MKTINYISILIITVIFHMFIGCNTMAGQNKNWTFIDTANYFKELPASKQKDFIHEVIVELNKNSPIQLNKVTQLAGIYYMRSFNTIVRVVKFDVPYNSIDQGVIKEFAQKTKERSINSFCSKRMFKLFMFETNTEMRTEFDCTSGQRVFTFTINKNDCLAAGYTK